MSLTAFTLQKMKFCTFLFKRGNFPFNEITENGRLSASLLAKKNEKKSTLMSARRPNATVCKKRVASVFEQVTIEKDTFGSTRRIIRVPLEMNLASRQKAPRVLHPPKGTTDVAPELEFLKKLH